MSTSAERGTRKLSELRLVEFPGKYQLLTAAELDELPDDRLVTLIAERRGIDESRAREALAIIRRSVIASGGAYERV